MIHVVDDNQVVLDIMVELIESFGFRARPFISARNYLLHAASDDFDPPLAVITDVMMPEIDGFTLMQRVRAHHPEIRFVIMSGEDQSPTSDRLGACIYLRKPIHFDMLDSTFRHLRQCRDCGASNELARSWPDERERYGILEQGCPLADN